MKLLRLRSGVVGVACAMVVGSQLAAVEVPAGFFVDIVASGPPLDRPIGLQANPDGTFFVTDLGPDALTNSAVLLMTTSGQLSSVFSGTPLVTPIDAQRPPAGSPFGSALFISDQDSFGGFGALFRQEPDGQLSVVFQGSTQPVVHLDSEAMAFGTGGGFGFDLFVADAASVLGTVGCGATGGILRVTPQGVLSSFVFGPPLVDPIGLAFGPGGVSTGASS